MPPNWEFCVRSGEREPNQRQIQHGALSTTMEAEAVRQGFFGLILGVAYPVLRARHRPDRAPELLDARPHDANRMRVPSAARGLQ